MRLLKIVQLRKSSLKVKVICKRMCHVQSKKNHFYPFTAQIHVKTSFDRNEMKMVKESKTGDLGNYDFSRNNQNVYWKTTLR